MARDRELLRELAGRIAEIAHLPAQAERRKLHLAVNNLKRDRPVVLLDELPWNQLNGEGELTLRCEDEFLRDVEQSLRRTLYKWNHCPGDMIVEPFFRLRRAIAVGDIGVQVQEHILAADRGNNIVSHRYIDQLPDMASLEKLRAPEVHVDDALTERRRALLDGAFGDLLPVRAVGLTDAGFFMPWDWLSKWRGVEPLLIDLVERPELLHAFMRKILSIQLDLLAREEALGLLDANMDVLHCTAALVDELPQCADGPALRRNIWGRGTAQIFASVSPAMHDEFEIEYAKEFFSGFGLVYYGCCEPLHDKMDIVKKLPNLRKISVTPWADVRKCAEQMGGHYAMARKPNPAAVAVDALDEPALRADILATLDACRDSGTPCEFTLKDISSINYRPHNLARWERVVMETVRNY